MTKIRFELAPKPNKAEKAAMRENRIRRGCDSMGEESARMLGWNAVRVWSKTLSELWAIPRAKLNLWFIRLMLKRLANE